MKILDIDWSEFLDTLKLYLSLPLGARRVFVEKLQPSQPLTNAAMGEWREALLGSGLMVAGKRAVNAKLHTRYRSFCRAMRALRRNKILETPNRDVFHAFASEHLEYAEITAFSNPGEGFSGYYDYYQTERLYARACSAEWLKQFLAAKDQKWEKKYMVRGAEPYFSSAKVLSATQALVMSLAQAQAPTPISELPSLLPGSPPDESGAAIRAGIRYLLFYPALRKQDWEPILGVWPSAARRLVGKAPRPPRHVTASETFHHPFLMEDMTTLLSACAVEPLRVRGADARVFARTQAELERDVGPLPQWVEMEFGLSPEKRVSTALGFADACQFLTRKGRGGRDLRLEVTGAGLHWLGLDGKDRLKALVDWLRSAPRGDSYRYGRESFSLAPNLIEGASEGKNKKIISSMMACFIGLGDGVFVRRSEFLVYHKQKNNPLAAIVDQDRSASLWIDWELLSRPSIEELEEIWEGVLARFLRLRLLPLGGVEIGRDEQGAVCFSPTEAGRYLLGAAPDFDLDDGPSGQVVMQPNFDIVFLTPSPNAEFQLARFCERRGRHVGTLFKVTKQSILSAAAAGLKLEQILETLRRHCSGGVPGNVEVQISGWCAQHRKVTARRAYLIHCPDPETASRVAAAAGKTATWINETVLELRGSKVLPSLLRKLREAGIFVRD